MKKLFVILILCIAGNLIYAQSNKKERFKGDDIYFENSKGNKKIIQPGEMTQSKLIIENLNKYRKERLTASVIQIAGAGAIAGSFAIKDQNDTQLAVQVGGGALILIGYIMSINAERHLNKKNLTFTGNGLALRF
ncbi:MAG: hypothetical protein ACOYMF_05545 [Bacteroidales bacterium]